MDKLFESSLAVIAEIPDGANIMFGGVAAPVFP